MLTKLLVAILTSLLLSCTTSLTVENKSEVEFFDINQFDYSTLRTNEVIGISGPYSTKEKEFQVGILNAAKQIALHEYIKINSALVIMEEDEELIAFATKDSAKYEIDNLSEIVENLNITKVFFDDDMGAMVFVESSLIEDEKKNFNREYDINNRPTWLQENFTTKDYEVAVGSTFKYKFVNDSLEASDYKGAIALLEKLSSSVTDITSYTKTHNDSMSVGYLSSSKNVLEGFVVLDRWHEDDMYYSLVGVPKE